MGRKLACINLQLTTKGETLGYQDDFRYGGGWASGRAFQGGCGVCRCGGSEQRYGPGRGFDRPAGFPVSFYGETDVNILKRCRERLELRSKDLEAEITHVDYRIMSFEKSASNSTVEASVHFKLVGPRHPDVWS